MNILISSEPLSISRFTIEGTPDVAPDYIIYHVNSSTEIYLSWENVPSESLHGTFKGYKVTYGPTYRFDYEEERKHIMTMTNETVLRGLHKNLDYNFMVAATTSAGDGVQSEVFSGRTQNDGNNYW